MSRPRKQQVINGSKPVSTFQGFPPICTGGFSTSLPVYVGNRANIWGMDTVSKDVFKMKDEPQQSAVVPIETDEKPKKEPAPVLRVLRKQSAVKNLKVQPKIQLSESKIQKMEQKMKKFSAYANDIPGDEIVSADGKMSPPRFMSPADRLNSGCSSYESPDDSRPGTTESGRRSPFRALRPPSPGDDDENSLSNAVTPLKAAPKRKAAVMIARKGGDFERSAKYIPKKINLPKQMSHLFRTDAIALSEIASAEINEMSFLEIPDWNKYFGDVARIDFHKQYERAYRGINKTSKGQANFTKAQSSPRSQYLREIAQKQLPPLSLLMRKQTEPKGLDVGHRGLGDEKILPLIHVIEKLPVVNTVIVCDNRLTDKSLTPLMKKLPSLPMLMHLDLSYNKIDKCSEYLMMYLRNEACQLQILVLDGSDVDDVECTHIAEALTVNTTLLSLSLRNNKIGTAELQNVATPNFVTGGEGLGRMLLKNRSLLELDLSWNYIRLDSACAIAEALIVNNTLRVLKVAHNGFGDLGTQVMGMAIKQNERLQVLDMSYNSIMPKAAAVLQNGLVHNEKINMLVLDGNILGHIGARALVSAVQRASGQNRILRISFVNCDCEKDVKGLFDAAAPGGSYELDLSEPYGQMVAEECLYLLDYRVGCELKKIEYTPKNTIPFKTINLERQRVFHKTEDAPMHMKAFCSQFLNTEKDNETFKTLDSIMGCFDLYPAYRLTRRILEVLRELYAEQEMLAVTNFQKKNLLKKFEEELLILIFKALFRIADDDMSGEMCLEEFYHCLDSLGVGFEPKYAKRLFIEFDKDNSGNIDDEEFGMIMINEFCRQDSTRGGYVQRETSAPWPIPAFGLLKIELEYQCEQAAISDVSHDEGISNVIAAIRESKTELERMVLFEQTVSSPYYYMSAQQALMLYEEVSKHIAGDLDVIARMLPQIVNSEQRIRFLDTLINPSEKLALRVRMGQVYNCLLGLPTGHYCFDLKVKDQRNLGRALAAIWGTETKYRRGVQCDTSQKGNYSNFRNEMIGMNHVEGIDSTWFSRCPQTGKLTLDYVSTTRPRTGIKPILDNRYRAIRKLLNLEVMREYNNNPQRLETETFADMGIPECFNVVLIKEAYLEFMSSCHHELDIYPPESMRDMSRTDYNPDVRPETPDILKLEQVDKTFSRLFPLALYKLFEMQLILPNVWLSGQQAKELVELFPPDNYVRVQAYISLFSRIVEFDQYTAAIMSDVLTNDEQNEAIHRLGILNVLDPLYSDRMYKLDLRRWDHREMCRAIVRLAIDQPGENLKYWEYRWSKYDSAVPGWTLPMNWVTPDEDNGGDGGPRRFGWTCLEYYSSGLHLPGVKRACYMLRLKFHAGCPRPVMS